MKIIYNADNLEVGYKNKHYYCLFLHVYDELKNRIVFKGLQFHKYIQEYVTK